LSERRNQAVLDSRRSSWSWRAAWSWRKAKNC